MMDPDTAAAIQALSGTVTALTHTAVWAAYHAGNPTPPGWSPGMPPPAGWHHP
jgi:hypothetical protein